MSLSAGNPPPKYGADWSPVIPSVKTRLQVQVNPRVAEPLPGRGGTPEDPHYASTWDALSQIFDEDGLRGLYTGIHSSLVGVASTNFAYFYWYSIVRTLYQRSAAQDAPSSTVVELGLGAVAGAVAQVFTIPVAVVTTRQQTQRKGERKGFFETGREVIDGDDGVSGLWRGLKASLVLVVNPAITYGAYERLKDVMFPGKKSLQLWEAFRTWQTFVLPRPRFYLLADNIVVDQCLGPHPKRLLPSQRSLLS